MLLGYRAESSLNLWVQAALARGWFVDASEVLAERVSEQVQIRPRESQRFVVATWVSEGRGCVRRAAFLPVASACAADAPARSAAARLSRIGAGARLQTRVSGPRVRCSIAGDSMCLPVSE